MAIRFGRYLALIWALWLVACSPSPTPAVDAGLDTAAPAPPPPLPPDLDGGHRLGAFPFAFPVGPAGGSLSGTYPNPSVSISNLDASALSPGTAGQVPTTLTGAASVAMKNPVSVSVIDGYGVTGNGSTDDTTNFQSALTATVPLGQSAWAPVPGNFYLIAGNLHPQSGSVIRLSPSPSGAAVFKTTNASAFTGMFNTQETFTGASATLHANATFGQSTFQLDSLSGGPAPVAGNWIYIAQGNTTQYMPVTSVMSLGGASYTIVSSEGIVFPFTTAATIAVASATATDITLEGNGALVSGPGVRVWESFGASRMRVNNLRYDTSLGTLSDAVMSFDGGGYDSQFRGIWTNGSIGGIGFETQVRALATGCTSENVTGSGSINAAFFILDSYASGFVDSHARSANIGYRIGSNGGGLGNNAAYVRDSDAIDCPTGVHIESGSVNTELAGFFAANYTAAGILADSGSGLTTVTNYRAQSGPTTTTWMINAGDDIAVSGWKGSGPYGGLFTGTTTNINNVELSGITGTGLFMSGTAARVSGGSLSLGASSVGVNLSAGALELDNLTISQTGAATGISVASGTTLILGPNVTLTGVSTPLSITAGGTVSIVQTGGVAAVSTTGGTTTLTPAQWYDTIVSVTGALTSDATITVPAFPGWTVDVQNAATGAHNVIVSASGGSLTLPSSTQGSRVSVYVNASGAVVQGYGATLFATGLDTLTSAAESVGTVNASSVSIGHSGISTGVTGNFSQSTGTFALLGNGASSISTTAGNTTVDSAATLALCGSACTSVTEGNTSTTTSQTFNVEANDPIDFYAGSTHMVNMSGANGVGFGMTIYPTSGNTFTDGIALDPWAHVYSADFDTGNSPTTMTIGATKATTITEGSTSATTQQTYNVASNDAMDWYAGATHLFQMSGTNGIGVGLTIYPFVNGGDALGAPTLAWGAAYFGAGNGGYTSFPAITGTHNTQDGIVTHDVKEGRLSTYSAGNFNAYTLPAAHHGFNVSCRVASRVVTQGSAGTCSFWGTGAGTADHTFRTNFSTAFYCTASGTCVVDSSGSWYYDVDTQSLTVGSGASPTNPLIGFGGASVSGLTVTLSWQTYNDACTNPPVLDVVSACDFIDN